ncbi:MAG: ATP-binding cassette domain-containing protein [Spirochaetales bacterium]|nr:ATP-binding cassette domain-containing protein [Spirochaetales bacterium]
MFSIQNLSFRTDRPVFTGLNAEIPRGSFIRLTGPNGCGKTSLLRILAGLVPSVYPGCVEGHIHRSTEQQVEVKSVRHSGFPGKSQDRLSRADSSTPGICLTGPWAGARLFCRTVDEEICFSPGADRVEAFRLLEYFGLTPLADSHPQALSGGQQQLILLIAYLSCSPDLLLLDECFPQLSGEKRELLAALLLDLNRRGRTIVMAEHSFPKSLAGHIEVLDLGGAHDCSSEGTAHTGDIFPGISYGGSGAEPVSNLETLLELRSLRTAPSFPVTIKFRDLTVCRGDIVYLKGGIGSGKTTLVRIISGLMAADGSVVLKGRPLTSLKRRDISKVMAVVLQSPENQFFCSTVEEELTFALGSGKSDVSEICTAFGLKELLGSNPHSLSQGEKKRCQIASALLMKPDLLVLDEPDAGLDRLGQELLVRILLQRQREGGALIFTSHSSHFSGMMVSGEGMPAIEPNGLTGVSHNAMQDARYRVWQDARQSTQPEASNRFLYFEMEADHDQS